MTSICMLKRNFTKIFLIALSLLIVSMHPDAGHSFWCCHKIALFLKDLADYSSADFTEKEMCSF